MHPGRENEMTDTTSKSPVIDMPSTTKRGDEYLAAVRALTLRDIRYHSPVLDAWLDQCGQIEAHIVRVDQSTLEGDWSETDGRVMADLVVVTDMFESFGIRIETDGLLPSNVHMVAIHAPTLGAPLGADLIRALLDDPSRIAAEFDRRADMLTCLSETIEGAGVASFLMKSTKRLVDGVGSIFDDWKRVIDVELAVDRKTMGRTVSCLRADDGRPRWNVPATATVVFAVGDGQPAHTDFDVVVSLAHADGVATIDLVDLPPAKLPGLSLYEPA